MIKLIAKIYNSLSWRLTLLYISSLFVGGLAYTIYEQRDFVLSPILPGIKQNSNMSFSLSKKTEAEVSEAVKDLPWIVGAAVMSADLRLNEARTVFFVGTEGATKKMAVVKKYAIFSNQEDSNITAISLINGEFTCGPFSKTAIAYLTPDLEEVITICRISIPSYYGYFSGFITIFLAIDPDPIQQQQIKLVFSSVATSIYFKDVLSTQRWLGKSYD